MGITTEEDRHQAYLTAAKFSGRYDLSETHC